MSFKLNKPTFRNSTPIKEVDKSLIEGSHNLAATTESEAPRRGDTSLADIAKKAKEIRKAGGWKKYRTQKSKERLKEKYVKDGGEVDTEGDGESTDDVKENGTDNIDKGDGEVKTRDADFYAGKSAVPSGFTMKSSPFKRNFFETKSSPFKARVVEKRYDNGDYIVRDGAYVELLDKDGNLIYENPYASSQPMTDVKQWRRANLASREETQKEEPEKEKSSSSSSTSWQTAAKNANKSGESLSDLVSERDKHVKGSNEYNKIQNKINGHYGVDKRHPVTENVVETNEQIAPQNTSYSLSDDVRIVDNKKEGVKEEVKEGEKEVTSDKEDQSYLDIVKDEYRDDVDIKYDEKVYNAGDNEKKIQKLERKREIGKSKADLKATKEVGRDNVREATRGAEKRAARKQKRIDNRKARRNVRDTKKN